MLFNIVATKRYLIFLFRNSFLLRYKARAGLANRFNCFAFSIFISWSSEFFLERMFFYLFIVADLSLKSLFFWSKTTCLLEFFRFADLIIVISWPWYELIFCISHSIQAMSFRDTTLRLRRSIFRHTINLVETRPDITAISFWESLHSGSKKLIFGRSEGGWFGQLSIITSRTWHGVLKIFDIIQNFYF